MTFEALSVSSGWAVLPSILTRAVLLSGDLTWWTDTLLGFWIP